MQIEHEEVKLSLSADDMIFIQISLKMPPKKLLGTINNQRKVARYEINVEKSTAFLYTKFQKNKWKKIPFAIASKRIKYLGINLTKYVKGFKSCKMTLFQKVIK